jgi:signal transduction histidine kinase
MRIWDITKKMRNLRSLTITLAIAFLSLSAVVILVSTSFDIYPTLQAQQEAVKTNQELIAKDAANTVKNFVIDKFDDLERAVRIGDLSTDNQEEQKTTLEKLIGLEPAFRQLTLLNSQGKKLVKVSRLSSFEVSPLTEQMESNILLKVSQGEKYISLVYIDEITSEPMVVVAVPVKDVFGDFKGALIAEVNLKFMWDLLGSINVGEGGVAYVVDNSGDLIAFGDLSRVLKRENLGYLEEVSEFVTGNIPTHESNAKIAKGIEDTYVVTTRAHLGNPNWAVVVELPVLEAYKAIIIQLRLSLLAMLLSFVLAIVAGIFLSKRITKPIITLRDAAVKIGRGSLDTEIKINKNNEIGDLASAFNDMTRDLKKSRSQILQHEKELESKIQQRTKDLQNKVDELNSTKTAILNMMEDTDDVNRNLIATQTDLKKIVKQLKEVDAKKDEFISIAAHELKTPLTSIRGFADLLQNPEISKDPEKRRKYFEIIKNDTTRLGKLITDILDLSRVDLGTLKLNKTDVKIDELVKSLREQMDVIIKEKGITPVYEVEKNLPSIKTDVNRLIQVLSNLIVNAVKYTEKGGRITIRIFRRANNFIFSVQDTGIGISKEDLPKIFERFYQADSSYTRQVGGTGLGLAIAKEIINTMGGSISVTSTKGKGAMFIFNIPIK